MEPHCSVVIRSFYKLQYLYIYVIRFRVTIPTTVYSYPTSVFEFSRAKESMEGGFGEETRRDAPPRPSLITSRVRGRGGAGRGVGYSCISQSTSENAMVLLSGKKY